MSNTCSSFKEDTIIVIVLIVAAKILTFPDEYDSFIPNVTAGDYILDVIQQYGNDIACVSALLHFKLTKT